MKQRHSALLLLFLLTSLAACSPGHLGSNVIAFLRDGQLWTIDPNGANAFAIAAQSPAVIGYSWSPTHQVLAFRSLDSDFAKTAAAKRLVSNEAGGVEDAPSTLSTIGVDGGSPIPVAFSSPDTRYSNAIWDTDGSRLLFRQTARVNPGNPASATWWVSQNDQPGGIAIKALPGSFSIPSLSYVSQQYMSIGNSNRGVFTTTLAGTNLRLRSSDLLPGHPLPATLERVLWRPAHQDREFLYAAEPSSQAHSSAALSVQLVLSTLNGQKKTLATCSCTQFAWSPDGNTLLYSTGSTYTIADLQHTRSFSIAVEPASIPYWSPDSQFLLLNGTHTMKLVHIASRRQSVLLSDGSQVTKNNSSSGATNEHLPAINALLQPVANSVWAADSRHFLFLSSERLSWQGQRLSAGKGLYSVTIDNSGHVQGAPVVVDTGKDTQAGWTYQDANTSFLY